MNLSSKLLEDAVNKISLLPGIGSKTATRLVLHLLRNPKELGLGISSSIEKLVENINYCKYCHNISDTEICLICKNPDRDKSVVCVVEDIRDVIAIESTEQFLGVYHVLGGKISPMDGINAEDLKIDSLEKKVKSGTIKEVIFAISSTVEGDTTSFYIYKKIKEASVNITVIARGISVGDELEYTDEHTLARSIQERVPYCL
ncbi:recombination mediator RecR [Ichthyobacterium seriolicida]|uniref:Recombination protein RecR n=1 Tax=Ichthyobacterium seriolicida TaxID=242600 RepID=A0A1J1E0I3_9FLAO|nr:recombination mediator RecR [Ichthyobacterium seriolicida]BAV94445.1 recombination protein RecR [Ichthyobacterium seriolicida]